MWKKKALIHVQIVKIQKHFFYRKEKKSFKYKAFFIIIFFKFNCAFNNRSQQGGN